MERKRFVVSEYMDYRCRTRGYDIAVVEARKLVLIPYEETDTEIRPVTVHATNRRQIRFRLNTGRFVYG